MLDAIAQTPTTWTAARLPRHAEAACPERDDTHAEHRAPWESCGHDADEPRPYWEYLEGQNARLRNADRVEWAARTHATPTVPERPPAPADLRSAKIGDVSPVRLATHARAVEQYVVARRQGAGRLVDVIA